MKERILLMGGPGTGKSHQLIKVCEFLKEKSAKIYCIDCEDKLEATLLGMGYRVETEGTHLFVPELNIHLYIANFWEELKETQKEIDEKANPNEWIMVDRIDLTWPSVQRYYTRRKYQETLAERLIHQAEKIKKPAMFIPRFDQGDWQPVNEEYDTFILGILYKQRCNVLLTAGIRASDSTPYDIFGNIGVVPRGQKELPHQPHSTFLLFQTKKGRDISWYITTAKDLPNRPYFDDEELLDFSLQYLGGIIG